MTTPDLTRVVEYFEARQDVRDGADGTQRPNEEMQNLTLVEDASSAWDRVGDMIEQQGATITRLEQTVSNWKAAYANLEMVFRDLATDKPYVGAADRIKTAHGL